MTIFLGLMVLVAILSVILFVFSLYVLRNYRIVLKSLEYLGKGQFVLSEECKTTWPFIGIKKTINKIAIGLGGLFESFIDNSKSSETAHIKLSRNIESALISTSGISKSTYKNRKTAQNLYNSGVKGLLR